MSFIMYPKNYDQTLFEPVSTYMKKNFLVSRVPRKVTCICVILLGNCTCSALIPIAEAALIFIRIYTLESSRPPTCTIAKLGSKSGKILFNRATSLVNSFVISLKK